MQIGECSLVIEPGDFWHKALDKPEHALGAIDETTLDFPRFPIFVAIASLVEEALGSASFFRRWQIEKGQEIAGLVMRALLLKLGAALNINEGGRDIQPFLIGYVENFVRDAAGKRFNPHVTIGVGTEKFLNEMLAEPFPSFTFSPMGASVYQLGAFGTARKELKALTP